MLGQLNRLLSLIIALGTAHVVGACDTFEFPCPAMTSSGGPAPVDPSPPEPAGDLADIVASDPQFSTLFAALHQADLVDLFKGPGPLTVFAPTNAAFNALPAAQLDALLQDKCKLAEVLKHHVISGSMSENSLRSTSRVQSLADFPLLIDTSSGTKVSGSTITTSDLLAANGRIHVIDRVILPPERSILEVVESRPELSTMFKAISDTELGDALSGTEPLTLLAPSNSAFLALFTNNLELVLEQRDFLLSVLRRQMAQGSLFSSEVEDNLTVPSLIPDYSLIFKVKDDVIKVNGATLLVRDIVATNGVVHVISRFMSSEPDVADEDVKTRIFNIIAESLQFSAFLGAMVDAGLPYIFARLDQATLFLPTDAAFAKLPEGTLDELLKPENAELLRKVLLHHVVLEKLPAASLRDKNPAVITSASGLELLLKIDDGISVSGASVIQADLDAENGVVHVIDHVILPPELTPSSPTAP